MLVPPNHVQFLTLLLAVGVLGSSVIALIQHPRTFLNNDLDHVILSDSLTWHGELLLQEGKEKEHPSIPSQHPRNRQNLEF